MKVVIIEDEVLSQEQLERLLQRLPYDIEIVSKLESVKACFSFFETKPVVDLIFMDIHLADGNAFDFLKDFTLTTPIIFTTAFDQYTLNAFKVNVIDYLLKPIDKIELEAAIQKHLRLTSKQQDELLQNIRQLTKTETYKTRFMVKLGDSLTGIKSEEIHHLRYEDGIVLLVTANNKRYPLDYSLDQLETMLDPNKFFRINRKVIIQIDSIERVGTFFNNRLKIHTAFLIENDAVVSRDRVGNFKSWFNQ